MGENFEKQNNEKELKEGSLKNKIIFEMRILRGGMIEKDIKKGESR